MLTATKRLALLFNHFAPNTVNCHATQTKAYGPCIEVQPAPCGCEPFYSTILTQSAVDFVAKMVVQFDAEVDRILNQRKLCQVKLDQLDGLPDFSPETRSVRQSDWSVSPLPRRLQCRHVDLGDVSPANTDHFVKALQSKAQGIQTDFDDGHCPVWSNQLRGLYNVYSAVHGLLPGTPKIADAPVLMLRPRAWNMVENNMMVNGKAVPGPLFDFGLLMYHNAKKLITAESGPFFYLPKLEGYKEARLWKNIFLWTEQQLGLPMGTIKACVLIENILASFEMEEILYEMRYHSAGLNCGIWDYSASFVNKFGQRPSFVLCDRNKYVSMDCHFLKSYMDLVIEVCHRRGALATGGMAALLLSPGGELKKQEVIQKVCKAKLKEIQAGADGFMVYDLGLVSPAQELFKKYAPSPNQIHIKRSDVKVAASDLLQIPPGGVTLNGLRHNIAVGIMFIYGWFQGQGHYFFKGAVEDSATAEISRSQVWQWIRHQTKLEDASKETITRKMVRALIKEFIQDMFTSPKFSFESERKHLVTSAQMFEELVTKKDFPEFITTYLYEEHAIRETHKS